jgi:CRP-like cAMP-binding protein
MSSHLSKHRSLQDLGAISDDCDSKCNNHLSSSIHSLCSLYEPSPMSPPDPTTPSAYPPMTPTGTFKKEISGQKQLQQGKDDWKKPLGGDPSRTPVSLGVPHTTPETARTRGFVGAKISDRVTKFDANPLDGALLSPMQMHASVPSFNIASPPLAVGGEDEEELPLSPMHVPRSVPSKKRSVRHKKIEIKAQVFDSPTPQNNRNTQVLLSPQEVRELVKSSNTNHRLDQLKYHYEHLSEEESKERRRLAAKIAAKERRRRLGTTTTNSEARRLVWEQSRAKFRNEPSSGPTLLAGLDETNDLGDDVFDEVRAISYDFSDFSPPSFPKTNHQRQLILDAVARDFPFSEFRENGKARTEGAIDALIDAFEPISLQASEVLLHQGVKEGNDRFYILECGIIDVQQEGVSITQVNNTGESFGQIALMYHKPSNVTISVALSSQVQGSKAGARLLRIDQKTYRGLLLEYSQKARKEKKDVLCKVDFLRDLVEEDDFLSNKLASTMVRHEFKADDELGICEDSSFFLVRSGTLRVVSKDGEHDEVMTSGGYFGERSLIGSLSARATCSSEMRFIAQSSGVFFSIDKQTLEQILGRGRLQNLQDIRKLATTALVKKAKLTRTIRDKMASAITELKLDGEKNKIWKIEKTQKPELYVVREGPVLVSYTDEESGKEHKTEMKAGDTFGHEQVKAVSSSDGTKFRRIGGLTTSTVCGKTASISVIPLEEVVSQLGASNKTARPPLPAAANKPKSVPVNKFSVTSQKRVMQDSPAIQLRKKMRDAVQKDLTLDQLEKIRLLGEGEFGEVWMVTADVFQTGVPELRQTFALKTQLRKDDSRGKNATADILREIQLLKEVDHPQVVDLVTTFEDKDAIHILMGLIPGGELWDVIHTEDERGNWRSGMPEGHTKFVTMVLADTLDFIHSRDIVFRDLKPGKSD